MKIGVVGPIWEDIPPKGYGGTELVVYNLVNGLVDKGEDVTLFGPGTSKTKAKLESVVEKPLRETNIGWSNISYNLLHLTHAFDLSDKFDLLHIHLNKDQDFIALPLAQKCKTPILFTFHFRLPDQDKYPDSYQVLTKYKDLAFTSISNSQRANLPLNFIKTVYNGIDINIFPFNAKPDDYYIWLGKINPYKGTKEAILAAKKANVTLLVAGAIDTADPRTNAYYEEEVKPLIDNKQIIFAGEVTPEEKTKLFAGAKAFLNPITWREPFGLVMAESQAVGTPVISFNNGAAPEIIADGKTGFLVDTVDEMVDAMSKVDQIDRAACRRNIEEHFTQEIMVDNYIEVYKQLSN